MSNFGSIHTTSMVFTSSMYHLAARPEYLTPIRQEIESVISECGWTKAALMKMVHLDSFIKESQRYSPFIIVSPFRKALKDFTFSNGTTVPAGSVITTPLHTWMHDPDLYDEPHVFKGFRFVDNRAKEVAQQLVTTGPEFMLFGHGKHACPGRFLAAAEVKMMFAHILLNYDIQLKDGSTQVPEPFSFGNHVGPNTTAQVYFRARKGRS